MKRQPRSHIRGGDVALWNVTSDEEAANEYVETELTSSLEDIPLRKHFFYVGTPKQIRRITEEERLFQKDEIQVPSAVQLDKSFPTEKNMRSLNPTTLPRNSFLTQPEHYSRHRGTRGYPSISNNIDTLHKLNDGAASKRWPSKPLTSQPKTCLSRDPEDLSPP